MTKKTPRHRRDRRPGPRLLAAACGGTSPAPSPKPLNVLITNDDGIEAPGSSL